jgi:DNA topoisomerase-1
MNKTPPISLINIKKCSGFQRKKQGRGFVYYTSNGKKINDPQILERIKLLAIPPAYTHVWICPDENGHIQAVGRDNKDRKQYIYHPLWVEKRQQSKFKSLLDFGYSLPLLRKKINEEIHRTPTLDKSQIICSVLFLIDNYSVRVGNDIYAQSNQTYGVTTLRKKHIIHQKKLVSFKFLGKNKHPWSFEVTDENIVQILKRCCEIPGYKLFKFYNEQKTIQVITSKDVNEYLYSITQYHFTAKDFRTWIATREFFSRVISLLDKNIRMKYIKNSLLEVATLLGHTPTICKTSYIHPQILDWLKTGKLMAWKLKNKRRINTKSTDEILLLWLEELYSVNKPQISNNAHNRNL